LTVSCARALTVAVEPVCGVGAYAWRVEPDVTSANGRERQMAAPRRDFAVTLVDGRRVVGRYHDDAGERSAYVYPLDTNGPILGSGTAGTLAQAGLSAMTPGRRSAAPASSCGCLPAIPGARRPRIRRGPDASFRAPRLGRRAAAGAAASGAR
jgi:hypothetical protein